MRVHNNERGWSKQRAHGIMIILERVNEGKLDYENE